MSNNSKSNWTKHLDFFISDLLAVVASFFVANALMHNIWGRVGNSYQVLLVVLIIFDLLVAIFGASYRNILRRDRYRELISMFIHVATVAVLVIIALFGLKISASYSRLFIGYFSISFFLVGYAFRIILKRIVRLRILKSGNRRMLVIAPKKYVAQTIKGIRSDYYSGISLSGVILSDEEENSGGEEECIENVPVIPIKELEEYIKTNIVDEIVMNGAEGSAYLSELIDDCLNSGVTVHSVNQRFARVYKGVVIDKIGDLTTVSYHLSPITPLQALIKRLIDIISGLFGSVIAIALVPIVGLIILTRDPGPIFFKHERVGRNGRLFKMFKFRTMYVNSEKLEKGMIAKSSVKGPMVKIKNDPRIYPGGGFLRKFSIDEFPQFFNILKGDMSLVGTRPPSLVEYEQYELHHKKRLVLKPGLTGLWQVSGRSNIDDFENVVALDEKYMLEYSLFNDFIIIFKTIPAVILKRGAS